MHNFFNNLLKSWDFLGLNVNFKISNSDKYKTKFGGFLSIIICIGFMICVYVNLEEFFFRKNPTIQFSEHTLNKTKNETILFNKKDFIFAIKLLDENSDVYDINDYFEMNFLFIKKENSKEKYFHSPSNNINKHKMDVNQTFLKMKKCKISDFTENEKNFENDIDKFYCPDLNNETLELFGKFGDKIFSFFRLNLNFCNETENFPCEKSLKFNKEFSGVNTFFQILHKDIHMDPYNYENPLLNITSSYMIKNSIYLVKEITMFLKDYIIETDYGIFMANKKRIESVGTDHIKMEYDFNLNIGQNKFLNLEIYNTKNFILYGRSYLRLYDVFENACIFITWTSIIFKLFYDYYNEFKFGCFLYNKLVRIDSDDKDNNQANFNQEINKSFQRKNNMNVNSNNKNNEDNPENKQQNNPNKIKKTKTIEESYEDKFTSGSSFSFPKNIFPMKRFSSPLIELEFNKRKNLINEEEEEENDNNKITLGSLKEIEEENSDSENVIESKTTKRYKTFSEKKKKPKKYLLETINQKKDNEKLKDTQAENEYNSFAKEGRKFSFAVINYIFLRPFNKKIKHEFNIMKTISDYFNSKFDIFYYFRKIKNLSLLNKFLFEDNQLELVKIISNKNFFTASKIKNIKEKKPMIRMEDFKFLVQGLKEDSIIDKKIYEEIFLETMKDKNLEK